MKATRIAFDDAKGRDITSFDEANQAHRYEIRYLPSHLDA
jgi:hypothetical protein